MLLKDEFHVIETQMYDVLVKLDNFKIHRIQTEWIENLQKFWHMEFVQMAYIFKFEDELKETLLAKENRPSINIPEIRMQTACLLLQFLYDVQSIRPHLESLFSDEKRELIGHLYSLQNGLDPISLLRIQKQFNSYFDGYAINKTLETIETFHEILNEILIVGTKVEAIRLASSSFKPCLTEQINDNNRKAAESALLELIEVKNRIDELIQKSNVSAKAAALGQKMLGISISAVIQESLSSNREPSGISKDEYTDLNAEYHEIIIKTAIIDESQEHWLEKWMRIWSNIGLRVNGIASLSNRFTEVRNAFHSLEAEILNEERTVPTLEIYDDAVLRLDAAIQVFQSGDVGASKELIILQRKFMAFIEWNEQGIEPEHLKKANSLLNKLLKVEKAFHPLIMNRLNGIDKRFKVFILLLDEIQNAETNEAASSKLSELKALFWEIHSSLNAIAHVNKRKLSLEEEGIFKKLNALVIPSEFDEIYFDDWN